MSTDDPAPETAAWELTELAANAGDLASALPAGATSGDPDTLHVLAALRATREELARLAEVPAGEPAMPSDVAAVLNISLEWEVLARAQRR